MGAAKTTIPGIASEGRWTRQAYGRHALSAQWGALGDANRRTVGGDAAAVSSVPDLPPTIPAMGANRRIETGGDEIG